MKKRGYISEFLLKGISEQVKKNIVYFLFLLPVSLLAQFQPVLPTQEQINKGDYYNDLAKQRREQQNEIYKDANETDKKYASQPAIQKPSSKFMRLADTSCAETKAARINYAFAAADLERMLNGTNPMSLKRAVFIVENTYYENKLDYNRYETQINKLVLLCKKILKNEGFSEDNKAAYNYAIQKLFSDTLKIDDTVRYPFVYDYVDFMGDNDYSKQFVTKLLNTGKGQCHSMPLLYLILAQELNTEAYLTIAPAHSYIKYRSGNTLLAFECTNGRQTDDKFMMASGYISLEAVKNKIYLAPQTLLQTITQCMTDLATQYSLRYGYDDYVMKCCNKALQYNSQCLSAWQSISNLTTAFALRIANKHGNPPLAKFNEYTDLKNAYNNVTAIYRHLDDIGYLQIPKEDYTKWLQLANNEEQKREQAELNNKMKNNSKHN